MRTLALLLLLLSPVLSQEPAIDLDKITADELGAVDWRPLVARANEAYNQKKYEEAARAYVEALRANPSDSTALYNLACCFGLLGKEAQAVDFLKAAWNAGFKNYEHISKDPDFDKVRGSDAFRELLGRMETFAQARKRAAGEPLRVESPVLADVRVVAPDTQEPGKRYPLLIGLHGYGDNGEAFAGLFVNRKIEQPFFFCTAQAPYPFALGGRVGYSWHARTSAVPGAGLASHRLSSRYVLDVLAAVRKRYPIDERNVFLMGFSQGGGMAYSVGMRHPEKFRAAIPIGGWCDPAEFTPAEVAAAKEHAMVLVCHSPTDTVIEFARAEEAMAFFEREKIPSRLVKYEGGHVLSQELVQGIADYVMDPVDAKVPAGGD